MIKKVVISVFGVLVLFLFPFQACAGLPGDINGDGVVSISEVQTVINAFLGLYSDNIITTAMFSGKSFTVDSGTLTFNVDGTLCGAGMNTVNETWTINSSGQLVVYNTGKGTATFTFVSGDATSGWTGSLSYSNGSAATVGTFVPVTTPASCITTVVDPATSLLWQIFDSGNKMNWYNAVSYCSALAYGGYSGWRLPSSDELKGLDASAIYNQIQGTHYALVNGIYFGSYWSSTSYDNSQAYHVFLSTDKFTGWADKSGYTNLVRCVRP